MRIKVHDTLESDFKDDMATIRKATCLKKLIREVCHLHLAKNGNQRQDSMIRHMVPSGRNKNKRARPNLITRYMVPRGDYSGQHDRYNSVAQREALTELNRT